MWKNVNTYTYIYIYGLIYKCQKMYIYMGDARYVAVVSPPGKSEHHFVLAHYGELHYESTTPLPDSST